MSNNVAGVNIQRGMAVPQGMAVLRIVDDWDTTVYSDADEYRLMNGSAYGQYPAGTHVVVENETDNDTDDGQRLEGQPQSVIAAYNAAYGAGAADAWYWDHFMELRRNRRHPLFAAMKANGKVVHCPAEKPQQRFLYDPLTIAICDEVDFHFAVYELVDANGNEVASAKALCDGLKILATGKPWNCSEMEADPNLPWQMDHIAAAMAVLIKYGCKKVYAWGDDDGSVSGAARANVNDRPDLMAAIKALNVALIPVPKPTSSAQTQAEQAYNLITGGTPFIPGKQFVQPNGDGTFNVVVQFPLG